MAAASTALGISVMTTMSYSPKANHAVWILPPSFSIAGRTASIRSWGLLTKACQPSREYAIWWRKCGMGVPPVVEIAAHRRTEREQGQDELWNCVLARTVVLFAVYDELSTQVRMVQQSLTLPDGT